MTILPKFDGAKILVVGDVMLDRYWFGDVNRISPEAPVPVLKVERVEERPGGAANVARNIAALGAQATLLSVVGDDEAGACLERLLNAHSNLNALLHRDNSISTIIKLRAIARHQQLLRIDFETPPSHEVLHTALEDFRTQLRGWDDIHALGFNKTEEDEMVFAQMMMSVGVYIPFPYFHLTEDTKFLDKETEEVRKNVMDFYESSIKRFMHANDASKTYLAKNVMSTGRFKTLMQRFPDAKIIYIARHPYDAVPSFASMFSSMYKLYVPPIADNDPAKKTWARLGIDYFKYSQEMKRLLPPSQFFMLKYDDLLADPQGTVLKLYKHFNWQPSQKFLDKLSKEEVRNRQYKSLHEYSLEQYGFTRQEVYAELGPIMDELGFDKEF